MTEAEAPGTPAYLTHVSVRAASHPLDELEVLLRVPPLDLAAWPGIDIHDTDPTGRLLHIELA